MSFSFSASGTRTEVLAELAKVTRRPHAAPAQLAAAMAGMVTHGPEEHGTQEVVYQVNAYGHSGPEGIPALSVTIRCAYRAR